jgi:hypothetical protein
MQGQLVGRNGVFCHGVMEQGFELNGTFRCLTSAPMEQFCVIA